MKKILFFMIALTLVLSLIACDSKTPNPTDDENIESEITEDTKGEVAESNNSETATGKAQGKELIVNENFQEKVSEEVKSKYSEYSDFSLGIREKGLEVYVWQMAEEDYSCVVVPKKELHYTAEQLLELDLTVTSMEEMQKILSIYSFAKITVIPILMPHSSYHYEITEEYTQKISDMFFEGYSYWRIPRQYGTVYDVDIDSDGVTEDCYLGWGWTSGIFSFTLTIMQNDVVEYQNHFYTQPYDLCFIKKDGQIMVQGVEYQTENPQTDIYEISFHPEYKMIVLHLYGNPDATLDNGIRLPE